MIYVINKEGMVLFRGDWNNTSKLKEVLHSINENKIFTINNTNSSEAFGITLEPEGGSKTPTLEQLYTLGTV